MKLHIVDILIICAYLMVIVAIGLFLKKKAAKNMDSYFLGGKSLPFYMLGLSNASGMFDITGTMLMVYWAFAYGFKSLWIPWLWPVFNQIFLMVYLSVWLRRSNVLTGAEWIKTRFGQGRGATLSHTIVIVFALLSVLGFLSYGFIGIGKFMEIFFPWEVVSQYVPWDGLGGIQYSSVTQKDENGVKTGSRDASKMRFRLNLANINIGMTVHLWDKKKK